MQGILIYGDFSEPLITEIIPMCQARGARLLVKEVLKNQWLEVCNALWVYGGYAPRDEIFGAEVGGS